MGYSPLGCKRAKHDLITKQQLLQKKKINRCQLQGDSDIGVVRKTTLSSNYKTILHEIKVSPSEIKAKIEVLRKEMEKAMAPHSSTLA